MSKTGTSNEVSTRKKKGKDLLSEYPYDISTSAIIFEPGRTKLKSTVHEMVELPETEFVIVKLENGTRAKEDSFDKIPVTKSTAKRTSKKSSSSKRAEER